MTTAPSLSFPELRKLLHQQGFEIEKRNGGHWCARDPSGSGQVFFADTSSDHRAIRNTLAELRRTCPSFKPPWRDDEEEAEPSPISRSTTKAESRLGGITDTLPDFNYLHVDQLLDMFTHALELPVETILVTRTDGPCREEATYSMSIIDTPSAGAINVIAHGEGASPGSASRKLMYGAQDAIRRRIQEQQEKIKAEQQRLERLELQLQFFSDGE